jgi:hypothetical protein
MGTDDRAAGARSSPAAGPHSHLFAVRLWKEDMAAGTEFRGTVRDVVTGAFRNFRDWSDLTTFMVARMEENEGVQATHNEGGRDAQRND